MENTYRLEITCSPDFPHWLHEQQVSLVFTTYQADQLDLVGLKPDGQLSIVTCSFDCPRGLYATPERLYLSGQYQLWQCENVLALGESDHDYDRLYLPRLGYTTGELDIHDIALDQNQRVVFVNTLYSCLAGVSQNHSFTPLWQPPFISELAPEDRCHLSGLAMLDGQPRYVTAFSQTDVAAGWQARRQAGGCLIEVPTNETVLADLSMPHSPRFYLDTLWLLNSGTGEFGYVDLAQRLFEPVIFCPGYLRGLAFCHEFAVVGLSKPRWSGAFADLTLGDWLAGADREPQCGLMVIDLNRGKIVHWLQIEEPITEIYDVQVLPGVRCPTALAVSGRMVTFERDSRLFRYTLPPPDTSEEQAKAETEPAAADQQPAPTEIAYKYHLSVDMSVAAAVAEYEKLTFPSIGKQAQVRPIQEPLITVAASDQGQLVGLALAEVRPDGTEARVLSLFVTPEHRGQGVGTGLLTHLERALRVRGCNALELVYRADWPSRPAIERLLQQQGWSTPESRLIQCKGTLERAVHLPWLDKYRLPDAFTIFSWSELTAAERQAIAERADYPPLLSPFQREDRQESLNSLGLRYQGRVVGWSITHRIDPDTIEYSALYVQPEFQNLGRAIPVLAASIKRQIAAGIRHFIFQIQVENKGMVRFMERYLRPYQLTSLTESRYSRKILRTGSS